MWYPYYKWVVWAYAVSIWIWFLLDLNFLIDHDFGGIMLRLLQEHASACSYGSRFGEYCNTLEKLQSGFLDTNKSSPTGEKPEELFSLVISKSDSLVIYKIWSLTEDVAEVRVAVTILFLWGCSVLCCRLPSQHFSIHVRSERDFVLWLFSTSHQLPTALFLYWLMGSNLLGWDEVKGSPIVNSHTSKQNRIP